MNGAHGSDCGGESVELDAAVHAQFSKAFDFTHVNAQDLPPLERWFAEHQDKDDPRFSSLRDELNATKGRLNRLPLARWHAHTRARNPAGAAVGRVRAEAAPELLTQAWCKFYECLARYPGLARGDGTLKTAHLCEAPGAFVAALNHYLALNKGEVKWEWTASTLNPFHEGNSTSSMINDDRFVVRTLDRWLFGADGTGDVLDEGNRRDIVQSMSRMLGGGADLVTADGSVDCQGEPGRQESLVAPLHLAEAACALNLLNKGGCLVLKMFTLFESSSRALLFLLWNCFDHLSAFKPATSKEGNSEVYLICRGFRDNLSAEQKQNLLKRSDEESACLFQPQDLPGPFAEEVLECARLFKELQCSVIERNLRTFDSKDTDEEEEEVKALRERVADHLVQTCGIGRIPKERFLTGGNTVSVQQCPHLDERKEFGTFEERVSSNGGGDSRRTLQEVTADLLKCKMKRDGFRHMEWTRLSSTAILDKLEIGLGRPVDKVRSSRFCPAKVMDLAWEVWQKSLEVEKEEGEEGENGDCERTAKRQRVEEEIPANHGSLFWDEQMAKVCSVCPGLDSNSTVFVFGGGESSSPSFPLFGDASSQGRKSLRADLGRLADLLRDSCARGSHLVVRNLRPVTRLRAGVLLLLAGCFEEVGLARPRGTSKDCVVFSEFTGDASATLKGLERASEAMGSESGGGQVVLELFPMDAVVTRESWLYNLLVRFNFLSVKEWAVARAGQMITAANQK